MVGLMVAISFLGCFLIFRNEDSHRAHRKLGNFYSGDEEQKGLKEVFSRLNPDRRVCRYYFGNHTDATVYCDDEYECSECHIHRKLVLQGLERTTPSPADVTIGNTSIALDRFFHRGHVWARPEWNGFVRIGIDEFASRMLTGARKLKLPEVGEMISQSERVMGVRLSRTTELPFLAPVSGEVVAVNQAVIKDVSQLAKKPGVWLLMVKPFSLDRELQNLLFGEEAMNWFRYEEQALRRMLVGESAFAADGGALTYSGLDPDQWRQFVTNFLMSA